MLRIQEQGVDQVRDEELVGDQQRLVLGFAVSIENISKIQLERQHYAVT